MFFTEKNNVRFFSERNKKPLNKQYEFVDHYRLIWCWIIYVFKYAHSEEIVKKYLATYSINKPQF